MKLHLQHATSPGSSALRAELIEAIPKLAHAIETGEVEPDLQELQALAVLCDSQQLPDEAARIRRWIGEPE